MAETLQLVSCHLKGSAFILSCHLGCFCYKLCRGIFFWHLHPYCCFWESGFHLSVFLTAAVPLATLPSSLSGDLSHPKLPSPESLLCRQMMLPLCTVTPAVWRLMVISCCVRGSRGR